MVVLEVMGILAVLIIGIPLAVALCGTLVGLFLASVRAML